jgi:hypothetical protein
MCRRNLSKISLESQTRDKQRSTRTNRTDIRIKFQPKFILQLNRHIPFRFLIRSIFGSRVSLLFLQ